MKKQFQALLLLCVAISFFGCQKESISKTVNSYPERLILTWLNSQKSASQPNKAKNIELLSQNLDFAKLAIENSHDGEKLLIIPINDRYKQIKQISESSVANLVLKLTAAGAIRDGNIVLYTSKTLSDKTIAANTFYAIVNTGEPACEGEFKFLSVTGRRLYTLTYEKGRLATEVRISDKGVGTKNNTEDNCIDWYLVTTIYYTDGSTSTTEEYLTTTCPGCDTGGIEADCPDDGSGGGGQVQYEYEKRNEQQWTVFKNDEATVRVDAWDLLKGRAGVFTSITSKGSKINWSAPYSWREDAHSGSFSGTTASSTVSGSFLNLTTGNVVFTTEKTKAWEYSEVFP